MKRIWRKIMKTLTTNDPIIKRKISFDNSKAKIDDISIFEYMIFDEFKNEETEESNEDSKKD